MCISLLSFFYNFQTLISGILAIAAAFILWHGAWLPVKNKKEEDKKTLKIKQRFLALILVENLSNLSTKSNLVSSQIKVCNTTQKGSEETKSKCKLHLKELELKWETLSTFPKNILEDFAKLKSNLTMHNYDIDRSGTTFGTQDFARSIIDRLQDISSKALSIKDKLISYERSFD